MYVYACAYNVRYIHWERTIKKIDVQTSLLYRYFYIFCDIACTRATLLLLTI